LNGPKSHNPQGKVKQKFFREWELFEEVTNQVGQILSKHIIYHRHTHCIYICVPINIQVEIIQEVALGQWFLISNSSELFEFSSHFR